MRNAVILVSGGLDSTTVLAHAKDQGFNLYCLSFDYGQRHRYELQAAEQIAKAFDAKEHFIFKLGIGAFGGSAQTDKNIVIPTTPIDDEIPLTYTPARNIIFLSVALGYAETRRANDIFIGVSAIDYSNYPDCRPEFIESFEKTANLATKAAIQGQTTRIHAPLIHLSKTETIQLGLKLGVNYRQTVSCYQLTDNGKACGACHSCQLRRKGFLDAGLTDPTEYI